MPYVPILSGTSGFQQAFFQNKKMIKNLPFKIVQMNMDYKSAFWIENEMSVFLIYIQVL